MTNCVFYSDLSALTEIWSDVSSLRWPLMTVFTSRLKATLTRTIFILPCEKDPSIVCLIYLISVRRFFRFRFFAAALSLAVIDYNNPV